MENNKRNKWVFLSLTRRICLSITIFIISITFIQNLFGKFGNEIIIAWGYIIVLIIPILILFWLDRKKNRYSGRIISKNGHFLIVFGTIVYFTLVLAIILIEPFFSLSIVDYRIKTLFFLIPIESTLLIFYWSIFYRGKFLINPDKILIEEFIEKKTDVEIEESLSDYYKFKKSCFDLVASNDLIKALFTMREKYEKEDKEKNKSTIILQRQFTEISKHKNLGLIGFEESQISSNKIAFAILEIIEN